MTVWYVLDIGTRPIKPLSCHGSKEKANQECWEYQQKGKQAITRRYTAYSNAERIMRQRLRENR